MTKSDNLRKAKEEKNDEFYTQLYDIESEISSNPDYVRQFQGKVVLCNCDDPEWSNFYEFFRLHFKQLGLKKLITTHYEKPDVKSHTQQKLDKNNKPMIDKDGNPVMEEVIDEIITKQSYKLEWSGEMLGDDTINMVKTPLEGDGDFRSEECIELLKEADIVATNPPFSLFREYVDLMIKYEKKFVILGNNNAITYKDFFSYLQSNQVWLGYSYNQTMIFKVADNYKYDEKITKEKNDGCKYGKVPAITWFTNIELDKQHDNKILLTKNYCGNESKYPSYYNYEGIDVSDVKSIPKDYFGCMGVPITFLGKFCADQFEIIGLGTYVPKTLVHTAYKEKNIICYEKDGIVVWTTPYTVNERKIGNSLRLQKDGLPDKSPYGRVIIRRKVEQVDEDN